MFIYLILVMYVYSSKKDLYVCSFFGIGSGSGLTRGKPFSCSKLMTGSRAG
jgi:hypothetical protein